MDNKVGSNSFMDSRVVPEGLGEVGVGEGESMPASPPPIPDHLVSPPYAAVAASGVDNSEDLTVLEASAQHAADEGVVESKDDSADEDEGDKDPRKSWRVIGKLALMAQSMNAKTIDIYHDRTPFNSSRFMVHPNSYFRRAWEVMTVTCVIYVCVMIPFIIGFTFVDWSSLYGLNSFIDFYFIADMIMTLRTGVVINGEVVMDPKKVARKYFRTWFIVDLISNFPLALFVPTGKSLKIFKLQKIPKLLRIGRLLKYLREYAKYYNLTLSFLGLAMGLHLFACLWAGTFNECTGPDEENLCDESEMAPMYVQCIHSIMLMFLGIGESTTYSSIARLRNPEVDANIEVYYLSIGVFFLGTVFSSFLFGNVLALLMSWDQQKAQFRNRMDMIKAEMKHYELPEELQHRVRRNYDYLWINQRAYSDMMLLNQPGISKQLRTTIALHLYKDLVKTVPFFAGSDSRFLGKVCLALETAVYLPGDTIIYYDDIGKEMFIVRKGLVEILVPDAENKDKRIYLRDGNFFGETALVIDVRRTNTVRAVNICDLNVLSKRAFNEIAAEYPEFGERMKRTVIKRQLDNMNIQSPAEKAKVHEQLTRVVEKSLKARRMSVSLRTIYRAKKLGDKLKDIADRATSPVRRMSRAVTGKPMRVRPDMPKERATTIGVPLGKSTRDLAQFSGVQSKSMRGLLPKPRSFGKRAPSLARQTSAPPIREASGRRILPPLDAVSRKLDRTELTMGLLPSALSEITSMVEQIRRTTEILSQQLEVEELEDENDDDDDDDEDDFSFDEETSCFQGSTKFFPSVTEETEEEVARRESNSIYVPHGSSGRVMTPSNATHGVKKAEDEPKDTGSDSVPSPTHKDLSVTKSKQ